MKKTSTDDVTFIGSGNVATHLALALKGAGVVVRQVLSREYDHAALLASRVGARPIDRMELLEQDTSVYILAVNDDALYDLALDLRLPHALVLHTSGSTPLSVLKPISEHHGVVWSPQSFVRDFAMDYSRLPLCIEGDSEQSVERIGQLFGRFTPHLHRLDFQQRRWAHLAAVMVSNFGNAINALAQELMERQGLDFGMLQPLAQGTAAKTGRGPLWPQQTDRKSVV